MSNIKLMNCGFSTSLGKSSSDNSELDVRVMGLRPGTYYDMNGTEVIVDSKTIHSICDTYNEHVKQLFENDKILTPDIEKVGIESFDNRNAPNQLDHDDGTVLKTVGNIIGFMEVQDINETPHLFMKVRVKGTENVLPVKDKRRRNVSVQYNPETYEFVEISWVVKGAAVEARAMLSKPQNSLTLDNNFSIKMKEKLDKMRHDYDIIQQTEHKLLFQKQELEKKLALKKYLVALCVNGKINRATADFVEHEIEVKKIDNPIEVVRLMESILPHDKFKPQYYKLKNNKEDTVMSEQNTPYNVHDFLASVCLSKEDKKKLGKEEDEKEEKKLSEEKEKTEKYSKEHSLKHKELMSKMAESYEKGDVEMAKKYHEKASKLSEDCADGMYNLSAYEVEEDSKKSDEVKKMSAQIAELTTALAKNKDEQNIALGKFKDEQMAVLSSFTEKLSGEFNSSDIKVLLSEISKMKESK